MRRLIAVLLVLSLAYAADLPPPIPQGEHIFILNLKDYRTGLPLENDTVNLVVKDESGAKDVFTEKSADDGSVVLYLDDGNYNIFSKIDDEDTPAVDFVGVKDVYLSNDKNTTLTLQRCGSIRLSSVDEFGTVLQISDVRISCLESAYTPQELNEEVIPETVSEVFIRYVPVGECKVEVTTDSGDGYANVDIAKGEVSDVVVEVQSGKMLILIVALVFVVLFIVIAIIRFITMRPRRKKEAAEMEKTENMLNILNTLDERELAVVELLLKKKGKMKQSKIARELLIPKTSMSRIARSLENKNIVELIPVGRTNMVRLTKWFREL